MNGLGDWIRYNADWAGHRIALDMGDEAYTYAQMDAAVTRRAHLLASGLGVQPGDHVAYLGFNSCEMLLLLFACARVGCSLLPLNNRLAPPEHTWILRHSKTRILFAEPEFEPAAGAVSEDVDGLTLVSMESDYPGLLQQTDDAPFADVGTMDDRVLLVYTSGTTGKPKGVVHKQRALFYNALNAIHAQEMRAVDHVLNVLPLFHSGGLNIQTTPAFYVGARVTLLRRFDPGDTLAAIRELKPTMFLAVPAVIQAMVDHPMWQNTDLSCLRMIGTGSSTVPDALLNVWHDRGVPAVQIYGMTESAPTAICLPISASQRKLGAAGKPSMHCDARIVDEQGVPVGPNERGEILLRGPNMLAEYLNEPELTAQAFTGEWFHTGDIGHTDDDGFFYVDDRKKDVIISGGENIYPAELENVLADITELAEYAVVGAPDPQWGEAPVACVVLREGAALSEMDILRQFQDRLARFKHPQAVRFFEQLPRNAMGKVLKFELRSQLTSSDED
jgi:fatty-acyl-CoA synthase